MSILNRISDVRQHLKGGDNRESKLVLSKAKQRFIFHDDHIFTFRWEHRMPFWNLSKGCFTSER